MSDKSNEHHTKEPAVEIGDKISVKGQVVEIGEIISQDYWGGQDGWYIEFKDRNGKYRYWKQGCDGGELIRKYGVIK